MTAALAASILVSAVPAVTFAGERAPAGRREFIDTHAHPLRSLLRRRSLTDAGVLDVLKEYGVGLVIFLPPPTPPDWDGTYGMQQLAPLARHNPGRMAFDAGGESLNGMLQRYHPDAVTPGVLASFEKEAEAIVASGAAGFGEVAIEHFSSGRGRHPYESVPADHPLLLALADIAARARMPIDIHMEAVPRDMPFPEQRRRGPNPATLHENIPAFSRLLAHNREAHIVWAHAGWDLSGERTVPLMRELLRDNANLYMSVKIGRGGVPAHEPLAEDRTLRPGWLSLLREFPDRFVVGSDEFFDDADFGRLSAARQFVDALPADLAYRIAVENAKRIYRLNQ